LILSAAVHLRQGGGVERAGHIRVDHFDRGENGDLGAPRRRRRGRGSRVF
jgi:hypothetical protein